MVNVVVRVVIAGLSTHARRRVNAYSYSLDHNVQCSRVQWTEFSRMGVNKNRQNDSFGDPFGSARRVKFYLGLEVHLRPIERSRGVEVWRKTKKRKVG